MQPQGYVGPPAGPAAVPAAKKSNKWMLWVGVGCLGLFSVCCVFPVGGFFIGNAVAKSDVEDFAREIASLGRAHDATALYGKLTPYARGNQSVSGLALEIDRCPGIATSADIEIRDVSIDHPFDDYVIVDVAYQTPNGEVTGGMGVRREDGELQLDSYWESPPMTGTPSSERCDFSPSYY